MIWPPAAEKPWPFSTPPTIVGILSFHHCRLLLRFVKDETEPDWRGYILGLLMFVVSLGQIAIANQYFLKTLLIGMRLRAVVCSAVYNKVRCKFFLSKCLAGSNALRRHLAADGSRARKYTEARTCLFALLIVHSNNLKKTALLHPISILLLHVFSIQTFETRSLVCTCKRLFPKHQQVSWEINANTNSSVLISYLETNSVASTVWKVRYWGL